MYMAFKHIHMTLALISILSFILRSIWAFQGSALLQKKLVKIAPHIIDTLLLLSAIALMLQTNIYPFTPAGAWLSAKLIALVLYIIFGVMTLKKAKNNPQRAIYFTLSLISFGYIFAVARAHTPWIF